MSLSIGAHGTKTGSTNPITTDADTTSASGSTFVVAVLWYTFANAHCTSVDDNKSNSYTQIGTEVSGSVDPNFRCSFFYKNGGSGGSGHTFSAHFDTAPDVCGVHYVEIKGALTSGALDQAPGVNNDAHNDTTPYVSDVTGTTAQANELSLTVLNLFTTGAGPCTYNWSANGYTTLDDLTDPNVWTSSAAYKILSSTGTQQSSCTTTGGTPTEGQVFIATFKALPVSILYAFQSVPFID